MVPLSEMSPDELTNYDAITDPIVAFLTKQWTGSLYPSGLEELRLVDVLVEQEIERNVQEQLVGVTGVNNETDTMVHWAEALCTHRVANEMMVFNCSAVEVLVKTVFRLGMQINEEKHKRASLDKATEVN